MYIRLNPEGARTRVLVVCFPVAVVPLSVLFTWVYNRTDRRLLAVIALHAAIDAGASYFFGPTPSGELRPFYAWTGMLGLAAGLVLWREGPGLGAGDAWMGRGDLRLASPRPVDGLTVTRS